MLVVLVLLASTKLSTAQTIGYAEALGRLADACGQDIDRYCKSANLGGGQVADCLERNSSRVSPACHSDRKRSGCFAEKKSRGAPLRPATL